MAACALHKTRARHRGVNNGDGSFDLHPFYKCPPVLAVGESGSHLNKYCRCCLPSMPLPVMADTIHSSPYPTIEIPMQSLMVGDSSRYRSRVLPLGKIVGVTAARLKALFNF